ncbi:MAG: phage portal protein [Clostridia bacterium]|nr:phage portal protein [Clostridia bacterium]
MLRYSKTKLESEDAVTDIFFKAQAELENRKLLYERFRRKLTDEELSSLSDEEIKVPLERYISVMSAGYFGGKAPVYKVKAYNEDRNKIIEDLFDKTTNNEQDIKEIEELISHIVDYNDDGALFLELVLDFLVKRACYEIYYKDNTTGEITIARSDALETVAIWDYSLPKNLIGIYRIIQTSMANGEYQNMVELTTAKGKRYYMDTPEKRKIFGTSEYEIKFKDESLFKEDKKMKQPRKWENDIPATAIEQEDGLAIFEPVISVIEAYQRVVQNSRNTFKYNDDAILVVTGYDTDTALTILDDNGNEILNPARIKEDEYRRQTKTWYLGTDGDVRWVLKDINDNALQNHKKTLMDIICLCSFCPNMTDLGFTSADNNSALEKKFFSLQQYIATFEGEFKKGLLRRWEIILNKFNKEKGKTFDFRDIEVKLQRNVPSDRTTDITNALKLRGLLSDETVINSLNMDLDAKNEISKMDMQNEENIQKNIENVQKIQQNSEFEVKQKDKVGDKDVELSQSKNDRVKEDLSKNQSANTKSLTGNI